MSAKSTKKKTQARIARKERVRRTIQGTAERPRLCVYKSLKFTYAQLISDESGEVICSVSSRSLADKGVSAKGKAFAKTVGTEIAKLAKEKGFNRIVFDRNGYIYHGRVAAVAEGAREAGLEF